MSRIFLGVMGLPYESDIYTTVFRIVDSAITDGNNVIVWTCSGATTLTSKALGDQKPRDLMEINNGTPIEYPSTALIVRRLIKSSNGKLQWYVCRFCAEERGVLDQIDEVRITAPFKFINLMNEADVTMIIGQC